MLKIKHLRNAEARLESKFYLRDKTEVVDSSREKGPELVYVGVGFLAL